MIAMEGSFALDRLQINEMDWGVNDVDDSEAFFDKKASGKHVAKCVRAVTESMLANHFGEEILDELFERYAELEGQQLAKEKAKYCSITSSMTKKV